MKPDSSVVDSISVIPFLYDPTVIVNLKLELPLYITKTTDINSDFCPLKWWKLHTSEIPEWRSTAAKVLLLQPSSTERVLSMYIEQHLQQSSRLRFTGVYRSIGLTPIQQNVNSTVMDFVCVCLIFQDSSYNVYIGMHAFE